MPVDNNSKLQYQIKNGKTGHVSYVDKDVFEQHYMDYAKNSDAGSTVRMVDKDGEWDVPFADFGNARKDGARGWTVKRQTVQKPQQKQSVTAQQSRTGQGVATGKPKSTKEQAMDAVQGSFGTNKTQLGTNISVNTDYQPVNVPEVNVKTPQKTQTSVTAKQQRTQPSAKMSQAEMEEYAQSASDISAQAGETMANTSKALKDVQKHAEMERKANYGGVSLNQGENAELNKIRTDRANDVAINAAWQRDAQKYVPEAVRAVAGDVNEVINDALRGLRADAKNEYAQTLGAIGSASNYEQTTKDYLGKLTPSNIQKKLEEIDTDKLSKQLFFNGDGSDYSQWIKDAAQKAKMSPDKYIKYVASPAIGRQLQAGITQALGKEADKYKVKNYGDFLLRKFNDGVVGQITQIGLLPKEMRQMNASAVENYSKGLGFWGKAGGFGTSMVGDLPLMMIGGGIGNAATKVVGTGFSKVAQTAVGKAGIDLTSKVASKLGATKVGEAIATYAPKIGQIISPAIEKFGSKEAAARYENFLLANMSRPSWYGREIARGVIGGSANMGSFMGTKGVIETINVGEDTSGSALLSAFAEGAWSGAKMGGAMAFTAPLGKLAPTLSKAYERVGAKVGAKVAELGTFVGLDAWDNRNNEDWKFTDSLLQNGAMIVGYGIAGKITSGRNPMKEWGEILKGRDVRGAKLSDAELGELKKYYGEDSFFIPTTFDMADVSAREFQEAIKRGDTTKLQELTDYQKKFTDFIDNPEISFETRQKVSAALFGTVQANRPLMSNFEVEGKTVKLRASDGELIAVRNFENAEELQDIVAYERNNAKVAKTRDMFAKLGSGCLPDGVDAEKVNDDVNNALHTTAAEHGMTDVELAVAMLKDPAKLTDLETTAQDALGYRLRSIISDINNGKRAPEVAAESGTAKAEDDDLTSDNATGNALADIVQKVKDNENAFMEAQTKAEQLLDSKGFDKTTHIDERTVQQMVYDGIVTTDEAEVLLDVVKARNNYENAIDEHAAYVQHTAQKINEYAEHTFVDNYAHNGKVDGQDADGNSAIGVTVDGKMYYLKDGDVDTQNGTVNSESGMVILSDGMGGLVFKSADEVSEPVRIDKETLTNPMIQAMQEAITEKFPGLMLDERGDFVERPAEGAPVGDTTGTGAEGNGAEPSAPAEQGANGTEGGASAEGPKSEGTTEPPVVTGGTGQGENPTRPVGGTGEGGTAEGGTGGANAPTGEGPVTPERPKTVFGEVPENVPNKEAFEANRQKYDQGKVVGGADSIRLSDGEKLEGHYVLTSSEDLVASHDSETFKQRDGMPTRPDGKSINDRDYEHDKEAQLAVQRHAANYDERAIQDIPVVTKDGIVVSGNDRTMSGQLAGKNGTDKEYVQYLLDHAEKFGLKREDVQRMIDEGKHPRVVMELDKDVPYTTETYARFNKTNMKKRNVVEEAVAQGKVLREKPNVISAVTALFDKAENLSDIYNDEDLSKALVQFLEQGGVITKEEMAEWLNEDGMLSDIGKKKFETIMTSIVLDEDSIRLLNNPEYKLGKVRQNIAYAIAELMKNERLGKDYKLLGDFNKAIELYGRAKGAGNKSTEEILDWLMNKGFADNGEGEMVETRPMDGYTLNEILLALQMGRGQKQFKAFFKAYNEQAKDASNGQTSLFDEGNVLDKDTIINQLIESIYGKDPANNRRIERLKAILKSEEGEPPAEGDAGTGETGGGVENGEAMPPRTGPEGGSHPAEQGGTLPEGGTKGPEGGNAPKGGEKLNEHQQYIKDHPMNEDEIRKYAPDEDKADDAIDYLNGVYNNTTKNAYAIVYRNKMAAEAFNGGEGANAPEGAEGGSHPAEQGGTRPQGSTELGGERPQGEGNGSNGANGAQGGTPKPKREVSAEQAEATAKAKANAKAKFEALAALKKKKLSDAMRRMRRGGEDASVLNRIGEDEDVDQAFDMATSALADTGMEYIKEGVRDLEEFKERAKEDLGDVIKDALEMDDKELDEYLEDIWNTKKVRKDGTRKTLAEWAKEEPVGETTGTGTEAQPNTAVNGTEEAPTGEKPITEQPTTTEIPNNNGETGNDVPNMGTGEQPGQRTVSTGTSEGGTATSVPNTGGTRPNTEGGGNTNVHGSNGGKQGTALGSGQPKATGGSNTTGVRQGGATGESTGGGRTDVGTGLAGDTKPSVESAGESSLGRNAVEISQEKVPYTAASDPEGKHSIGSVIPSGAAQELNNVFTKLVKKVKKNITDFVRDELGFGTNEELLSDYSNGKTHGLASEQVDSVALAINAMKNGKSFIIGDMTGVGKGRQAAALIRWGKLQGKKVLFVTENSGLFSDMFRDLQDIDTTLRPFVTNNDKDANITDSDGNIVLKHPSKQAQSALWQSESDQLPTDKKGNPYDFVMTTYSQVGASEKTKNGENTNTINKKEWLKRYAKDAIVILDESHNASGNSKRGDFFRDVVENASGVTFLSATYAKRPDNMMLYAMRSSLADVNMPKDEMFEAIKKYGVPMQEILAHGLFGSGEMIRRERDFSDVKTEWCDAKTIYKEEEYEKARKTSDKTMDLVNDIIEFQRTYVDPIVKAYEQSVADTNKAAALLGMPMTHYSNTPYSGQASNIVNLLTYGLKAKKAAEMAIEQIKEGKKPVIAVENTLGSYIDELDDNVASAGYDAIFNKGVKFALRYNMAQYVNKGGKYEKDKDTEVIFDAEAELGDDGQRALESLRKKIQDYIGDTDIEQLTLSPIDLMKQMMAEAGYKCGEITGRQYQLTKNADGTYTKSAIHQDKKAAARKFNGGSVLNPLSKDEQYDALILNVAGATGISLHASKAFGNQQKRSMIILQPARNVNTEVQMRGRVDRTGQVSRADYYYLTSPIPAEQKMTMMLKQKLASLDANSVGTEEVSSNKVDSQDMDNKYGDEVAKEFLLDHLNDINAYLEGGLRYDNKTREWVGGEGLLYNVLKGMQRLDCDTQEFILDELTTRYADKITYLDQNGINDLKTTIMNLDATTVDKAMFVKGKDEESDNEFAHNTNLERVEVNVLKKPMRSEDIVKKMKKVGSVDEDGHVIRDYYDKVVSAVGDAKREMLLARKAKLDEALEKQKARMRTAHPQKEGETDEEYEERINKQGPVLELQLKNDAAYKQYEADIEKQYNAVAKAALYLKPGMMHFVPLTDDLSDGCPLSYGRFVGFEMRDNKPRNIQAVFAVKDSRAMISIPVVNQEKTIDKIRETTRGDMEPGSIITDEGTGLRYQEYEPEALEMTNKWWDAKIPKNTSRQRRYMITGNILQACGNLGKYKGQIVTFTRKNKETGEVTSDRGLLLAENFDPENFKIRRPVTKDDVWGRYDELKDDISKITAHRQGNALVIKFLKRGREKLVNHPVMKDTELQDLAMTTSDGSKLSKTTEDIAMTFSEANADKALELLYKNYGFTKESYFVMPDSTDKPDRIVPTGEHYTKTIDRLKGEYGYSARQVQRRINQMKNRLKMDIENEELQKKIREAVQLRQAYYRRDVERENDNELGWDVIVQDQHIAYYDKQIERAENDEDMRYYKECREEEYNKREAMLEELDFRGVKGTEMHLEQGKWSAKDAKDLFDKLNKDEENKILMEKVYAKVSQLKMRVRLDESMPNSTGGSTGGAELGYNWKYMNAKYVTDQGKADTILHEMIHTVTAYADRCVEQGLEHLLDADMIDAINDLHQILNAIQNQDVFKHKISDTSYRKDYGVTNVREMLSEVGSNKEFREDLKKANLWTKVMDGILRFFGIERSGAKKANAYESVRDRLEFLIENFNQNAFNAYWSQFGSEEKKMMGDGREMAKMEDDFDEPEPLDDEPKEIKMLVDPLNGDDLSNEGKARAFIYGDRSLIQGRRYLQEAEKRFGGQIGNASAGAFNYKVDGNPDRVHGIARSGIAYNISNVMTHQLKEYRNTVLNARERFFAEHPETKRASEVFERTLSDIDKAIKWYDEFGRDQHQRIGDHGDDGIRYRTAEPNTAQRKAEASGVVRKAAADAINALGGKGHIHKDEKSLPTAGKVALAKNPKAMGWYDKRTGEVHIYLPNCPTSYDAEKTVLHEKVGHEGLRKVVGEENYKKFLMSVWEGVGRTARHEIATLAATKYGHDYHKAVDEWLAQKAEDFNLESDVAEQRRTGLRGMWQTICEKFNDMAHRLGIKNGMSEKDVREALWLSRHSLDNKDGNLDYTIRKAAFEDKLKRYQPSEKVSKDGRYWDDAEEDGRRTAVNEGNEGAGAHESDLVYRTMTDADREAINDNLTPQGQVAQRDYEESLRKVSHLWTEAFQNAGRSLQKAMTAIVGRGKEIDPSQDCFKLLNQLGSKNQQGMRAFDSAVAQPLQRTLGKALTYFDGKKTRDRYIELQHYVYGKHALERNRVLAVRDFCTKLANTPDKAGATISNKAYAENIQQQFDNERGRLYGELQSEKITLRDYYQQLDAFIGTHIKGWNASKHDVSGISDTEFFKYGTGKKGEYRDAELIDDVMNAEAKMGKELTKELWDRIGGAAAFTRQYDYDSGFHNSRANKRMETMFSWYVPLRGFSEDTAEDMYYYMHDKGNTVGKSAVKANGRTTASDRPVETLLAMGCSSIMRGNRNKAKQALVRFVRNNPNNLITEMKTYYLESEDSFGNKQLTALYPEFREDMTAKEVEDAITKFEADIQARKDAGEKIVHLTDRKTGVPYRIVRDRNKEQHFIHAWINGKDVTMIVHGNPRAAQYVNGQISNYRAPVLSWLNSFESQLATSKSLTFMARNSIRDYNYATLSVLATEGLKYNKDFQKMYWSLSGKNVANTLSGATLVTGLYDMGKRAYVRAKDGKFAEPVVSHHGVFNSMKNLFVKYRNGTLDMSNETERYFKEYVENGGMTGYTQLQGVEEWKEEIDNVLEDAYGASGLKRAGQIAGKAVTIGTLGAPKLIKAYFNLVDSVNEAAENQARFACYYASRKANRKITRAIDDAKRISVNFNLTGAGSATYKMKNMGDVSWWYRLNAQTAGLSAAFLKNTMWFFNAGVQGMSRTYQLAMGEGVKEESFVKGLGKAMKTGQFYKSMLGFAAYPFTLGFFGAFINQAIATAMDDDDDRKRYGENPYTQLPEYVRRDNWCLYLGHGRFAMLPWAIETRAMFAQGDLAASMFFPDLAGERPIGEQVLMNMAQMTPVDIFGGSKVGSNDLKGGIVAVAMPDIAEGFWAAGIPGLAEGTNVGWTGTPISYAPSADSQSSDKYDPKWQHANPRTGQGYVEMAKWLNKKSGGDDITPGRIDLDASKLEYLMNTYGSGPMKDVNEAAQFFANAIEKEGNVEGGKVPVLKAVYRNASPANSLNTDRTRWYAYKKKYTEMNTHINGYRKAGRDVDTSARMAIGDKDIAVNNYVQYYAGHIKKMEAAKNRATKRADRDMIQDMINETIHEAMMRIDQVEKK